MRIDYKNIYLQTFQDENIEKCSQSRFENSCFFLRDIDSIENSCNWIKKHRDNKLDTLFEIHLKETDDYIGAVGYKIEHERCEIGRFTLDIKNLRKYLMQNQSSAKVSPTKEACIGLIFYLYEKILTNEKIFARVFEDNTYSNALCSFFSTICDIERITVNNKTMNEYIISKEKYLEKYNEEKMFILYS